MVVWITGMSGAGKTTLSDALYGRLKPQLPNLAIVDGDVVRDIFGAGLGFAEADRMVQIRRIQGLAKMLADQGIHVIVAALYANPDLLAWNRENLPDYVEVYLRAPLDLLKARDPKGLYLGAEQGTITNMVGLDIPWHEPRNADLVIDASDGHSPDTLAEQVLSHCPHLARALTGAAR